MSWQAIELELERINEKLWRYRLIWLGLWTAAAVSALPLVGANAHESGYVWVFLLLASAAIIATFYLQHVYFQAVRKKQHLITELVRIRSGT